MPPKKKPAKPAGVGLDIGTMNIVSARRKAKGIEHRRMRDCFLDIELEHKKMLKLRRIDFVEREEEVLILGDMALQVARLLNRELRRPLSAGLISPSEIDSIEILGLLIKNVLGPPTKEGEFCCFSIPAAPIDDLSKDIVYHKGVFQQIVEECGYTALPSNEAMAIIFAETASEGFSGLALSFGAGMTNVALAVSTIEAMSFSVARSGDWIDNGAARSIGLTAAQICAVKEKEGFNLLDPLGREQQAISFYYQEMIQYVLDHIAKRFKLVQNQVTLDEPIPLVVSGGTSLAGGFMDFFKEVFEKKRKRFPIPVSEIRQASDPLHAVANGMLVQALQEEEP